MRPRQVPLALMEEGLVDAAVVAGVLSPKGKASPQEEPLFKIKAAAEAFRDMRRSIADTLEVDTVLSYSYSSSCVILTIVCTIPYDIL